MVELEGIDAGRTPAASPIWAPGVSVDLEVDRSDGGRS
jgi:hypothetical protein